MVAKAVGLTTYYQKVKWSRWDSKAMLIGSDYVDLVSSSGMLPILIPPVVNQSTDLDYLNLLCEKPGVSAVSEFAEIFGKLLDSLKVYANDLLSNLSGLVLIGGEDICPLVYGKPISKDVKVWNLTRDLFEIAITKVALDTDLPILAICRGIQILNVAAGGTLIQHLPTVSETGEFHREPKQNEEFNTDIFNTDIIAEPSSIVERIYGSTAKVKCYHHQSIDMLGKNLRVTAKSSDGIIEAIEAIDSRFVLGVQWHPEKSNDIGPFKELSKSI